MNNFARRRHFPVPSLVRSLIVLKPLFAEILQFLPRMRCGLCGEKGEAMSREYVKGVSVVWAHKAGSDICQPCFFVMNHARHLPNDMNMLALFAEEMRPNLSRIRKLGELLQAKREKPRQDYPRCRPKRIQQQ